MSNIRMNSDALRGTNKEGVLKPDEKGWYDVVLGALEYPNSTGAIYKTDSLKRILSGNNVFTRLLSKGCLTGELGHPVRQSGQNEADWRRRVFMIDEKNESHTIKEIVIDDSARDVKGNQFIAVRGKVKPSGPYGHVLSQKFADDGMNVCFSVRSFTSDKFVNGRTEKSYLSIITFDYVNEPGIATATKFNSPSLESYLNEEVDVSALRALITPDTTGVSMESAPYYQAVKETILNISDVPATFKPEVKYTRESWRDKW